MSIKERLKEYLSYKRLSLRELERQCDISNGVLGRLSQSTSPKTLKRIESNSDLNLQWLFTGEGEMLRKIGASKFFNEYESSDKRNGIYEPSEMPGSKERVIPFYDVETTGGYEGTVSASSEGALVGYIQPGGWFDGRDTAAIRHVGDSMTEYPNGCVLAVREVKDRHLLVPGRNYVIETSEYRVTKRVQLGSSNSSLRLYSTNTEKYEDGTLVHAPFEIEFEDIKRIFCVLGYIVNQTGEFRIIKP